MQHSANLRVVGDNQSVVEDIDSPIWILGQGSNCIFLEDFEGTVLHVTSRGKTVTESEGYFEVTAKAGENWHQLVKWCMQRGIHGLENLALIPGTVGAAPIQNIGAYGLELSTFIDRVMFTELASGKQHSLSRAECHFGYRESVFKQALCNKVIITDVVMRIPKQWRARIDYGELKDLVNPTPQQVFDKVVEIRSAKLPDPAKLGNAGSFFKNPIINIDHFRTLKAKWDTIPRYSIDDQNVKVPAAWLIEQAGFKGKRLGGIQCHPKQPLVLTNDGSGTAQQLLDLARQIRTQVKDRFFIELENEVRLIGKTGMISL